MVWKKAKSALAKWKGQIPDPRGDCVGFGKYLWEYLKDLGLPVVLLRYRRAAKEGQKTYRQRKSLVKYELVERLYEGQKVYNRNGFDELYESYAEEDVLFMPARAKPENTTTAAATTTTTTNSSSVVATAVPTSDAEALQGYVASGEPDIVATMEDDSDEEDVDEDAGFSDATSMTSTGTNTDPVFSNAMFGSSTTNTDPVFSNALSGSSTTNTDPVPMEPYYVLRAPNLQQIVANTTGSKDEIDVPEEMDWYYILPFDISTTIMMQFVARVGFDTTSQFLSGALWRNPVDPLALTDERVDGEATKLCTELIKTIKNACSKLMEERKLKSISSVILFAWRHSEFNPHTNAAADHYGFVRDLIKTRESPSALVTINLSQIIPQVDHLFDLYNPPFVDRRIIACFWTKVAELQNSSQSPRVLGLIGGRSGSLDIAAFAGVRLVEWDTCFFNRELSTRDANGIPDEKNRSASSVQSSNHQHEALFLGCVSRLQTRLQLVNCAPEYVRRRAREIQGCNPYS